MSPALDDIPPEPRGDEAPRRDTPATLGVQLAHQAQRLAGRWFPALPWLRLLAPVLERAAALPAPTADRFRRTDAFVPDPSPGAETAELPWTWGPRGVADAAGQAQAPGQAIAPAVRELLRAVVGPGTEAARIHTDAAADVVAREHRADAVTVGRDVYFQRGRFHPQEDRGFALLAHEAAHVLRGLRPDAGWRRATVAGVREEEQEAGSREQAALRQRRAAGPAPGTLPAARLADPAGAIARAGPPAPAAAVRPLAAAADRAVDATPAALAAAPNFEDLRQALYHDLMRQIRADFERGG